MEAADQEGPGLLRGPFHLYRYSRSESGRGGMSHSS